MNPYLFKYENIFKSNDVIGRSVNTLSTHLNFMGDM